MKRICSMLLALLLLAGCGAQEPNPTTETTVPPTTAPAPTAAQLDLGASVENETIALTLAGAEGEILTLQVRNKTDRALTVKLKSLTVNECVSHKQWQTELSAADTVEHELAIVDDSYKLGGTEQPEKIELILSVWEGETEVSSLWTVVYPGGAAWEAKPYTPELVLVDNGQMTIGVVGYDPADPLGYGVTLYLENKTRDALLFDLGEVKVDNSPCQPLFAGVVPAGKRSFAVASWYLADLQKLGIEAPSKLELPFAVYNIDSYLEKPLLEETFSLLPVWD